MTDYTKLRELATKAAPGPWTVQNGAIIRHFYPLPVAAVIADVSDPAHPSAKADAEYIAAASPDVVIVLLDEIERLRTALTKISEIRDSIVGMQGFNFSEHAYPLVAALNAAGFKGMGYEISHANLGMLIAQRDAAGHQLAAVSAARDEACDKLESWVSALPPNLQALGEADIARMRKVGK